MGLAKVFSVITIAMLLFINGAAAQTDGAPEPLNTEKGIALQGYDPVSYFTTGEAVKGNQKLMVQSRGATYFFSSENNRKLFDANPEKYKPQYGGWCAYAMGADGSKVKIDPATYKIVDGKLYLFYNFHFNNTLKKWNDDEATLKKDADVNWHKLVNL